MALHSSLQGFLARCNLAFSALKYPKHLHIIINIAVENANLAYVLYRELEVHVTAVASSAVGVRHWKAAQR
jgi:hypothetical protein